MFRCAQVHQVAAHVEKALGMQVNWLLNNTNASPHMRTNWRVLMYLSKARHVQGFLVVEQIGSAFKTTAPCSLRRDSVVTYDTSSRTPAQLGIRVRTAHSLPKHPFILIRTRDSSHRIEARKTPCIITYLSRPRLVDGKKKTQTQTHVSLAPGSMGASIVSTRGHCDNARSYCTLNARRRLHSASELVCLFATDSRRTTLRGQLL